MKLKDLIQGKKANGSFATATPATLATNQEEKAVTVANVATVSVANPLEDEMEETQTDERRQQVEDMLASNPALTYAIRVTDATTDPVIVNVSIKGIGTFDMAIPHAHYDGVALLEVLEQYSEERNEPQKNAA